MSLKIPFGLREGQLVGPLEVVNGLKCGCVCPGCSSQLIAKHPKSQRRPHFAHHNTEACSTGQETALHLAAKRVLIETREIFVPPISASITLFDRDTQTSASAEKVIHGTTVSLDSVEQEVRDYEGVIPDIVAIVQGKELFIEIAVTHFVDNEKLEKLRRFGIPVLEIFLEPASELPSLDEIKELVVSATHNRKWVVNQKQEILEQAVQLEAKEKLEIAKAQVLEKRKRLREEQEKYNKLSNKEKLEAELRLTTIPSLNDVPPFIGKRVSGDGSFGVSNSVWQLFLYRKFIHGNLNRYFNTDEVFFELTERFKIERVFTDAPNIAIYRYLQLLVDVGILEQVYGGMYKVLKHT